MSPPMSFMDILYMPDRFIFYMAFTMITTAMFSKYWIDIAGSAPRDVCRQLSQRELTIEGGLRDDALKRYLARYIIPAAVLGGMFTGVMSIVAQMMNPMSSGTGIILAITIVYQYFE